MTEPRPALTAEQTDRIIEMAWEDRTPFEAILAQFGLKENEVIRLMRRELKPASWRMWRARVQGRATKHQVKSAVDDGRFRSKMQRSITHNKDFQAEIGPGAQERPACLYYFRVA